MKAAVAKQQQFVGELEAEHARALQAAEQTAEARRRDLCDAFAEESGELEARLQAEAEANAALRRGLRNAAAVTAARVAAEKDAAETATAKAGEARAAHRAQFDALQVGRAEQLASVVAETAEGDVARPSK